MIGADLWFNLRVDLRCSSRRRTRAEENVTAVDELVLSQENQPQKIVA